MMRVLITRPRQDSDLLARTLLVGGVQSLIEPLLEIHHLETSAIDLSHIQGLLVTSANGVRAFAAASTVRDLAIWAVGEGSARAARDAGFGTVRHASGDVKALAALVCEQASKNDGALLHVAGTRLAGDLGALVETAGFTYRRVVLYEALASQTFSDQARGALRQGNVDGVLLYSPRTATTFLKLIEHHQMQGTLYPITAFCLSQAVAEPIAGLRWNRISIASAAQEDCLIDDVFRATGAR